MIVVHCIMFQKYPLSGHPGMNMRSDGSMRQPNMTDGIPESGSALANVAQWVQQQNANLQQLSSHSPNMNFGHASDGPGLHPNGRYSHMQQWGPSPGLHLMQPDMMGPQGYQVFGPQPGFPADMNIGQSEMMHDPMLKDNLTPQQLQKREQNLANLRKIKEMLLPELQSNIEATGGAIGSVSMMVGHGNPDGSMPAEGWPPPQLIHSNIGLQRPGMAMSPSDGMVGVNFMSRLGPGRPFVSQAGFPPNWENMTEQQREWWKLKQEFYVGKYQRQHVPIGMNMPPGGGGGGPNHSHMGFMQPMHRMTSPMSPSFPGNSAPSPHCGPMGMSGDAQSMMFGKQPEYTSMGQDQSFNHPGSLPREAMFPFGDSQMPPGRFGNSGEPFSPADFGHPIDQQGMAKMLPMYGPQKRKRTGSALPDDDLYKRLLPAPSPQTFSYASSIDGQELTITKQLNHAFQEHPGAQPPPAPPSPAYLPPQKSRATGGKKKKSQPKVLEQKTKPQRTPPAADSFMCPSPAAPLSATAANSASCQSVPAASPVSQMPPSSLVMTSNPRVINRVPGADPSSVSAPTSTTVPMKSSMNITSPSLANLAKGIDNLSAQIQQNPFRTVQMQENESDASDVSPADNNNSLLPSSHGGHGSMSQNPSQGGVLGTSSIPSHPVPGCNVSMQQMTLANPLVSPPGSVRSSSHSVAPRQGSSSNSLTDPAGLAPCPGQSPVMYPAGDESALEVASRFGFPNGGGMNTGPSSVSQSTFAVMGSSPVAMSSSLGCRPSNSGNMVTGNAKIQIQAQAPNTIQYLPSHPSSGGQVGDGMNDRFVDFSSEKVCTKGGLAPCGSMMEGGMHGTMMPVDVAQRRQMEFQMGQDHEGGPMHSQMRMDHTFELIHGPRGGSMHGQRNTVSRTGVPLHMSGGMIQDPASPLIGPGNMMYGIGNSLHHPRSPIMGPSGPMHEQASPIMGRGSMIGPGGHVMSDMMPMPGHMKPGMMPNGTEFGPMMMGLGGRGGEMPPDMIPITMQRRSMHPDAVMVPAGGPEYGMAHHEQMRTMQGCNMMGPEMGMMPMGGREPIRTMRSGAGMRPELMADKSRSNRSRQKARASEPDVRMRHDAGAGMMGSDPGGNRMGRSNQGMMGMEMMGGMMRPEMGMMGARPEMMLMSSVGPGGELVGMRPDSGMMMARGNGMASDMAMMSSRGVSGGRVAMSPDSIAMFNYGSGRRVIPPDGMDMCQPSMMPSGMAASGMCPPGMKPMVMQSPAMGQSPGPGMAGDPGFGVQYQQFQQQMHVQSQSPTMSSVMMRGGGMSGGPPDMMGRPPYDVMGPGPSLTPGPGVGFGQPQSGLGPSGLM